MVYIVNSKGDNSRISQIKTSIVTTDYKILQILSVILGSHTMAFTLQSMFYVCACALIVHIPKTSKQILQDNTITDCLKNSSAFSS